jgi:predicted ArsR family transcriptional regulator
LKDEQDIVNLLSRKRYVTTTEVATMTGVSRNSAAKYLEILRAKNVADFRMAGPSKLWFLVEDEKKRAEREIIGDLEDTIRKAKDTSLSGPSLETIEEALKKIKKGKS